MDWQEIYDISNGDTIIKLQPTAVRKNETKASVQIDTPVNFDGTTTQAYLVQSNKFNRKLEDWHPLPESPITLLPNDDSALLSTFSFTCKFLAVVITQGNATQGELTLTTNYNK